MFNFMAIANPVKTKSDAEQGQLNLLMISWGLNAHVRIQRDQAAS
jgi:hypothetical protein